MKKTVIKKCRSTTTQIKLVHEELTYRPPVDHTCTAPNAAQHKMEREPYLVRNRRTRNENS